MRALLLTLCLGLLSLPAFAADDDTGTPTLPLGSLEQSQSLNPDHALSNQETDRVYKQCRSVYPLRFTPSALDYYCTCTAAATQGVMTSGEYDSLQLARNRKRTNPVYQKYITQVIAPCMDAPTLDIEYYGCVMNRSNSEEIRNVITYCKCVSEKVSKHVQTDAATDIMTTYDDKYYTDPMEALWGSSSYRQSVKKSNDECRRGNMKPASVYN